MRRRYKEGWRKISDKLSLIIFNIPAYFFIIGFTILPIAYAFYISFQDWSIMGQGGFIGLSNYLNLLKSESFWNSLYNTFLFGFPCVVFTTLGGLILAVVLNQPLKGKRVFRVLSMIPWAIPPIICGIIWSWAFNADYGVINHMLVSLGITEKYIAFLSSIDLAMPTVILARTWREIPFVAILLLAALQSIPLDLYEAAKIDGANSWRTFRSITLPLILNQILLVLVFETMWSLRALDEIFAMTAGGPAGTTTVLSWFIYTLSFRYFNTSQAAAASFILAVITFLLAYTYIKLFYRKIEF